MTKTEAGQHSSKRQGRREMNEERQEVSRDHFMTVNKHLMKMSFVHITRTRIDFDIQCVLRKVFGPGYGYHYEQM
jgi:hypothetical protein